MRLCIAILILFILSLPLCARNSVYYASKYARLDSDVVKGGGTDDTAALQALLDMASDGAPLKLVMDGAALVTGLTVWPNTTIECVNPACGFFLKDDSNCAIIRNKHASFNSSPEARDKNISLIGGTWNHNAKGQKHDVPCPEDELSIYKQNDSDYIPSKWVMAFELYGVENLLMKDMTIRNQRTFTALIANYEFVNVENINIILDDYMHANNQDGFHFFGPGRFLNITNMTGTSGDDFIAIAPDERDGVSSITDVMIDGVHLNNADQGIRLLCQGKGELDRVLIKNVTGTFKGFGFIINPWFEGTGGNYRNIVIDTVDLHCTSIEYDYMKPFLFKLGGNIDDLVLRNIHYHGDEPHYIVTTGGHYMRSLPSDANNPTHIKMLTIEDLYVYDDRKTHTYFDIADTIDHLVIRNFQVAGSMPGNALFRMNDNASVENMFIDGLTVIGQNKTFYPGSQQKVKHLFTSNIIKTE
ncbi:MAG: hypothetical protein IK083_01110 [Abditibacteriota bacterium]|nr:hypothetical protein [Abditibacteriota bacterium]